MASGHSIGVGCLIKDCHKLVWGMVQSHFIWKQTFVGWRFVTTVEHNRKKQNNGTVMVVKGEHIDIEGGYSMEILWECHFIGDKFSILWLNSKLEKSFYQKLCSKIEYTLQQKIL